MNPTNKPSLDEALRQYADESHFAPYFAERLQARIHALSELTIHPFEIFAAELAQMFRRVALASAVVIALLGAYNLSLSEEWSLTAAFGLASGTDVHEGGAEMMLLEE